MNKNVHALVYLLFSLFSTTVLIDRSEVQSSGVVNFVSVVMLCEYWHKIVEFRIKN